MISGTVSNCNFTKNTAKDGGALYIYDDGNVTNCIFNANSAGNSAGAIYFLGDDGGNNSVDNCRFYSNRAQTGGAIVNAKNLTIENSVFKGNVADIVSTSNIYTESAGNLTTHNVAPENLTVGNFTTLNQEISTAENYIKLTKDYIYDSTVDERYKDGIKIAKENFIIDGNGCTIDGAGIARIFDIAANNVTVKNINFINGKAAGDGGAIYSHYSLQLSITILNCNFTNNIATTGGAIRTASGNVANCNFINNTAKSEGGAVYFSSTGEVTNCNLTNNSARYGGVIHIHSGNVLNCNFTDNIAYEGGAIRFFDAKGTVTNCNFVNNTAYEGGAIFIYSGNVTNCNFTYNTASQRGGAILFCNSHAVSNCNFTYNSAHNGGAIYFAVSNTVSNSRFLNNKANANDLVVAKNDNNITITFTGNNNFLNAIYSSGAVSFTNVIYWSAKGMANTDSSTPSKSNNEAGQNITIGVVVNGELVLNEVKVTDENGTIVLPIIAGENYHITSRHDTDSYYTEAERTISNMTFNVNVTSQTTHNRTVNITAKSNIYSEFMSGGLLFILPNGENVTANYSGNGTWWIIHTFDEYADYLINATYEGLDNVTINNAAISITKANSTLAIDNVELDYGQTGNVTATTTGSTGIGAKIDGIGVAVDNFTIPISILNAGNHTLTVTTIPDEDHNPVTKTLNITVNKINSTLTVNNVVMDYGDSVNVNVSAEGATSSTADIDGNEVAVDGFTVLVSGLNAGNHTLTVITVPDENHNPVTKTVNITVNKVNSTLTLDNLEISYGDNVAITTMGSTGITEKIDNNDVGVNNFTIMTSDLNVGDHRLTVTTVPDDNHNPVSKTVNITVNKVDSSLTVNDIVFEYNGTGSVDVSFANAVGINASIINQSQAVVNVEGNMITVSGLDIGTYTLTVTTIPDENHNPVTKTANVTVNKIKPQMNAKNAAYVINYGGKYSVTIKYFRGNVVSNGKVTFVLNGKNIGSASVNSKGVASITLTAKILKTAKAGNKNLKITYNGDYYSTVSKTVKAKINKEKTKIKAKKKTFKKSKKVKKYKITLKNSKGKAISKVQVTLKIKGKTYKATTNAKGKAVFKIKKLSKKGKYKATVNFKGNSYYKAVSKKVKITLK